MSRHDHLFVSGELRGSLAAQAAKLIAEVDAAPKEHVLHVDEDGWVAALVERWSVDTPVLHVEQLWQDEAQEVQVDVRGFANRAIFDYDRPAWFPGYRVKVHVPFSGEADVFKLRPSTFTYSPPRAELGRGELTEIIEYRTTPRSTSQPGPRSSSARSISTSPGRAGTSNGLTAICGGLLARRSIRVVNASRHTRRMSRALGCRWDHQTSPERRSSRMRSSDAQRPSCRLCARTSRCRWSRSWLTRSSRTSCPSFARL